MALSPGLLHYNGRWIDSGFYKSIVRPVYFAGKNKTLTSLADVWPGGNAVSGNHSFQAAAGVTLAVSSFSASDVVGGTGATAVGVSAVDINGMEQMFFLPLNGNTARIDAGLYMYAGTAVVRKVIAVNQMWVGPVWVNCGIKAGSAIITVPRWLADNMVASVTVQGPGIPAATTVSSSAAANPADTNALITLSANATLSGNFTLGFGACGSGGVNAGNVYAYDSSDTLTTGENNTIAKRLAIIATGESWAKDGWYVVPSIGAPGSTIPTDICDLLIYAVSLENATIVSTLDYVYGQLLVNYLRQYDQVMGNPNAPAWFTFDIGVAPSSGTPAVWPPANILEPLIVLNGGAVDIQAAALAAVATGLDVSVFGLLVARVPNVQPLV